MAAYATAQDVQDRMTRTLSTDEISVVNNLLEDAAVIIDSYNADASADAKKVVSVRMVMRAIGDGQDGVPMGATQGSVSALGYSQSWTVSAGTVGELYIGRLEKKLLGTGEKIGSYSPTQELVPAYEELMNS